MEFRRSMKGKRIFSLIDGLFSGFLFGVIVCALVVSEALNAPIPTDIVALLLFATILAVAMFVWSVHSALATKET